VPRNRLSFAAEPVEWRSICFIVDIARPSVHGRAWDDVSMQTHRMWERLSIWEWDDSERTVRFRRMVRRGEEFPFGYRGVHVRRRHYQILARFTLRRRAGWKRPVRTWQGWTKDDIAPQALHAVCRYVSRALRAFLPGLGPRARLRPFFIGVVAQTFQGHALSLEYGAPQRIRHSDQPP
jgi:hypothetical protein